MDLTNLFREERINGKVIDKFQLGNGNLGIIVQDNKCSNQYSVEFRNNYIKPSYDNLYNVIDEPFKGKGEYLDSLIRKNTYIDLTTSYSNSPMKFAYHIHSVSSKPNQYLKHYKKNKKYLIYGLEDKFTNKKNAKENKTTLYHI